MKYFLSALAALMSFSCWAGLRGCNLQTQLKLEHFKSDFVTHNYLSEQAPAGLPCQKLGHLADDQTIIDCQNVADSKGFSCFQITEGTWTTINTYRTVENFQACYACLDAK